jgi:PAS domain S-box-containing protein
MTDKLARLLFFIRNWFLNPHPRVTDPEKVQRSQLLSTILLVLIVLDISILAIVLKKDPTDIQEPEVRGAILLLGIVIAMYILNRLGYNRYAAAGIIVPFVTIFIYVAFSSSGKAVFLSFLLIPILLTAIFFSLGWTSLISGTILLLILVLLMFQDQVSETSPFWTLRNMWFLLLLVTGLLITFMWHLRTLEQIRQGELKRINNELEEDIKLRKLAESAQRQSEEHYRGAITAAGLVPYVIDYREKRFQFIGEDVLKLTGYTSQEIQPAILRERIQEEYSWGQNASLTTEEARGMFRSGQLREWRSDMRILTRTGESRWISDASIAIAGEDGRADGAIGILQDITIRKKTEVEHEKLIKELESRNAELERFTYTVSHDLRNPLVTIKGFVGMLEKDLHESREDKVASDLRRIENAADKMQSLLADLLELSRVGRITNPPEEVNLAEVIKEAIETLDARLRSKNVIVHCSLDLPTVYGDRIRLREVFENLLDNAAKYMGNQPNPMIGIDSRVDDGETVFFVKDNGIGIEPQYQKKIFGLFDKLNPTSEGTGIGLALIKRIIEVHGGRIWVESEGLGTGSTFCFTIPAKK